MNTGPGSRATGSLRAKAGLLGLRPRDRVECGEFGKRRHGAMRLAALKIGRHGSGGEKPIRLSGHAEGQLAPRGAVRHEVVAAIRTMPWGPAELGRLECRKDYPFHAVWNGVRYSTKQVRAIFVDEPEEIVVVTVYVYYF